MTELYHFDWNDQSVLSRGRLVPRVHFYPYQDVDAARQGENSARVQSLTGQWNFNWFSSPLEVPDALLQTPFDAAAPCLTVPMNWQYAGYGKRCYTDLLYPFPADPPHIPMRNETGVYRRAFTVTPQHGSRVMLRFEGVESAYHLYVNGQAAGYSQGSRMPAEFDITELVHDGENQLAVVVYQYSDGTYLEDQDMWWLGGITRDVALLNRPACYLRDMVLDPDYDTHTGEGILRPVLPLSVQGGHVELTVYDKNGTVLAHTAHPADEVRVPAVRAWTAETPTLYTVVAAVYDADGTLTEAVPQKIGFRHIAIENGVLTLNGRPIFMRGVNRHEYNPKTGRAVTCAQTRSELQMIKQAGLNAIRCSHYPNNPFFYDLCEELGLYVIDECDLETHGFEPLGKDTRLNSDPTWREAYLDRIERMVGRDRNRACVVMWSLGNESAYGPNFKAMYDWCKQNEPTRPVHYEGDFKNQSVDVSSTMYSTIGMLKELDTQQDPLRPHIHCEFAHAMGNGPGSLQEYYEVCENSRRIQGIFVWEFKDHGVYEKLPDGRECYRFGGEYGEKFHNGNFCMDGLVRSDGVPSPGFFEYARVAEPVHVEAFDLARGNVRVKNRFDFLTLDGFVCHGRELWDGVPQKEFTLPMPAAAPRSTFELTLPENMGEGCPVGSLVTLELEFRTSTALGGLPQDWPAGRAGVVLREETPAPAAPAAPAACERQGYALYVSGKDWSFVLDPVQGRICEYICRGQRLLEHGPELNYNRAYIDNDIKNQPQWNEKHLHSMRMCVSAIDWQQEQDALVIRVEGKFSPEAMDWGTDVTVTYRVFADGTLTVALTGDFYGPAPTELPKIGSELHVPADLHCVTWRGFGLGECYCDSKQAQTDGIWQQQAADMGFAYSCPQDNANRTGVRWAAMQAENGAGLAIAADRPLDMAVRRYSDEQLQNIAHDCELTPDADRLYLHMDYRNSGLGSGSCGPIAMAQYKAYPIHYAWKMAFAPMRPDEDAPRAARRAMARL